MQYNSCCCCYCCCWKLVCCWWAKKNNYNTYYYTSSMNNGKKRNNKINNKIQQKENSRTLTYLWSTVVFTQRSSRRGKGLWRDRLVSFCYCTNYVLRIHVDFFFLSANRKWFFNTVILTKKTTIITLWQRNNKCRIRITIIDS